MSSSSSPRETIQISLGPSSNAITAHLMNLQGLAITSSSGSDDIYCDPNTTHIIQGNDRSSGGTLVPRVLFIDEANHQIPATVTTEQALITHSSRQAHSLTSDPFASSAFPDSLWNGNLHILGDESLSTKTADAWNNGLYNIVDVSQKKSPFWRTACTMTDSPYSRYHCKHDNNRSKNEYRTDAGNPRHVVWDDEEGDEDSYEQKSCEEQLKRRWETETAVGLGQDLRKYVEKKFHRVGEESPSSSSEQVFNPKHWTEIWMPPWNEKSKVVLPFSSQSQLVPHWDVSYQNGSRNTSFLQEWKEDSLFENVRHMLEACDYGIQGASISTEGHGIYASLSASLLDELKQECKSAGRLVYHLRNNEKKNTEVKGSSSSSPSSWQEAKVDQFRENLCSGLALYDFTEKAHAVLPLKFPKAYHNIMNESSQLSLFRSSAEIAMALEATTLPFRFNGKKITTNAGCLPMYGMGLQNAPLLSHGSSDASWGSTATRLTFSEFLQVLQPSSSHSLLELDYISHRGNMSGSISNERFFENIKEGTSVQRDYRTRQNRGHSSRTRPRDVYPGNWLLDACSVSSGTQGLLSSLSYSTSEKKLDRSLHHHFALSTSVRSSLSKTSGGSGGITMSNFLTCLVEGMGIRYRPERSMATMLNQTLGEMTFGSEGGGNNYGAGIYWKYIIPQVETPVLAVLGNSTRSYASLNEIAVNMNTAIHAPRFRGYHNRDVSNGVLPELEDCEEALEACWNKRDVYEPPSGFEQSFEEEF